MIRYDFGTNYEKIYNGMFWMQKFEDYPIYHTHNYWEFIICKDGSFKHIINGHQYSFDKGDAILLAPGDQHSLKALTKKVVHLNIGISDETFKKMCDSISPNFYSFFLKNRFSHVKFSLERLTKIESHLKSILITTNKDEIQTTVSFVLFNILEPMFTNFKNKSSEMPEWFKDLLIQCNSFEHLNWKPHDVCDYANYSQAHINRIFRKTLNTTLVDYLIEIKMNNAIVLLTNSDMSLSNIVYTLGYNSVSYFSHSFKKFYHVSPYKYKLNFIKQTTNK